MSGKLIKVPGKERVRDVLHRTHNEGMSSANSKNKLFRLSGNVP